jgi:hypothetical protein
MIATVTMGIAQQARILSTPIPTAETGGRFIVPEASPRVDSVGMMVNPGEEINVTPRGEVGDGRPIQVIIKLDNDTLYEAVNRGGRSGDIYVFATKTNL